MPSWKYTLTFGRSFRDTCTPPNLSIATIIARVFGKKTHLSRGEAKNRDQEDVDETDNKVHGCNPSTKHSSHENRTTKAKTEAEEEKKAWRMVRYSSANSMPSARMWRARFQRVSGAGIQTVRRAHPQTKTRVEFQKPPSWSRDGINTALPRSTAVTNFAHRRLHAHSSHTSEGACVRA